MTPPAMIALGIIQALAIVGGTVTIILLMRPDMVCP